MKVKKTTVIIAGGQFGEDYESVCQRMLWKGVAYLAEVQPPLSIWEGTRDNPSVMGVMTVKGDGLKALEAAMVAGEPDFTGLMHHYVMRHLRYIHKHGVDQLIAECRERDPDRVFEWEGELFPTPVEVQP